MMSVYDSNWPPKAKWGVHDIPDLSGKVFIVTGGNSGIGQETVKALLQHNAKVYIAGHSKERCEIAIRELRNQTGKEAIFMDIDLANLGKIKMAVAEFQKLEPKLDVLINNAGVMLPDPKAITADGYDLQFGVNVIGHFYLTKLLMPTLLAADNPRIVNVSSAGNLLTKGLDFESFKDGQKRQQADPFDLYNQSKFANVVVAKEFARRYGDRGIVSTSLHPGMIVTNISRDMTPKIVVKISALLSYSADKGALTSLYAATSPETADANGKYLLPWGRIGKPNPQTQDAETGIKLWNWLEEQVQQLETVI